MKFLSLLGSFFNMRVLGLAILAGFRRLGINLKIVQRKDGAIEAVPAGTQSPEGDKTVLQAREED